MFCSLQDPKNPDLSGNLGFAERSPNLSGGEPIDIKLTKKSLRLITLFLFTALSLSS